jgi:hypothetical protein
MKNKWIDESPEVEVEILSVSCVLWEGRRIVCASLQSTGISLYDMVKFSPFMLVQVCIYLFLGRVICDYAFYRVLAGVEPDALSLDKLTLNAGEVYRCQFKSFRLFQRTCWRVHIKHAFVD